MGQALSSQDTASDSNAALGAAGVSGKGAEVWCLTLHQLVLQVEIEVQGLTLPAEALCKIQNPEANLREVKAGSPICASSNIL